MSIDPVTTDANTGGSFNRYAYANNSPYKYIDPDGRQARGIDINCTGGCSTYGSLTSSPDNTAAANRTSAQYVYTMMGSVLETGLKYYVMAMTAIMPEVLSVEVVAAGAATTLVPKIAAKEIGPTAEQLKNIARFGKRLPSNAKDSISVKSLPNEGIAAQATSPGRVPGSSAVYEKQIDGAGNTIQYTKTTYDPSGSIVNVKDKLNGGVFP